MLVNKKLIKVFLCWLNSNNLSVLSGKIIIHNRWSVPAKQKMQHVLNQWEMELKKKSVQNLNLLVNQMCHCLFNHQLLRNTFFLPDECGSSSQHAEHSREHTVRGLKINVIKKRPRRTKVRRKSSNTWFNKKITEHLG